MDNAEANHVSHMRCVRMLMEEEIGLSHINDIIRQYKEWIRFSKEAIEGRNTRSANRKADAIYKIISSFKLQPLTRHTMYEPCLDPKSMNNGINGTNGTNGTSYQSSNNSSSVDTSIDSDGSSSSRPMTRSLRQRCRTPEVPNKVRLQKTAATPCTPTQQSLRAHLKRTASSNSSGSGTSNVLSAALNQQHPSVSVTKIRQLLRADSAQKKREEEKERQERLSRDRKAKEERAEAQKKQLLEARAINAKLKREQRLLHAAEVRKAREEKLKEESRKAREKQQQVVNCKNVPEPSAPMPPESLQPPETSSKVETNEPAKKVQKPTEPPAKTHELNETFKKPAEVKNIHISIQDETTEDQSNKASDVAAWAKAPHLREALIKQYSKRPTSEVQEEAFQIIGGVELPVDLDKIFGPNQAVNRRYLCRTSSAVWLTPPSKALKRSSSLVLTPNNPKRK